MSGSSRVLTRRRVMIVDDHPMMRTGLAKMIGAQPDLEVCAEADGVVAARQLAPTQQPDLALVDISLPDGHGIDLVRELQSGQPPLPCLVLSMHDEARFAVRALRAGARGYLNKRVGGAVIVEAIRRVLAGEIYLEPSVASRLVLQMARDDAPATGAEEDVLTARELEILRLIGRGFDTHHIAEALQLSSKTVEVHKTHIKRKLGLDTSIKLHRRAMWLFQDDPDAPAP